VTVRFGARVALNDVSLDAPSGEVTAIVGADGAGKTTLLRVLAGALVPRSGTVQRPDAERIGYLASTSGTYPDLSVDENLQFAASCYGVSAHELRRSAGDFLERSGLAAARHRLAGNLSGGMRQKLGVIRALLHRPKLVVLDEPTTGVDPVSRSDLWWLIARAAAEGAVVVFSTTYLDEAERAGRLLVLDAGRTLTTGTPTEILASIPGTIGTAPDRPIGDRARRAWRRHAGWRVWEPDGDCTKDGSVRPDLQDAVTVLALERELEGEAPA
jgi:ABC-2 type transport system ATP-binding protein